MWAARTEATNAGTPCCGSPTAKLIGDLPGSMSPKSSRSRTKGERPTSARTGEGGETRSAAVMNIDKAAPASAAPGMSYHRCGEVKARLRFTCQGGGELCSNGGPLEGALFPEMAAGRGGEEGVRPSPGPSLRRQPSHPGRA